MNRLFTVFTFILLLSTNTYSSEHFKSNEAARLISGAEELYFKSNSSIPSYIRFAEDFRPDESEFFNWLKEEFELNPELNFEISRAFATRDGMRHVVYQPTFRDAPLEFSKLSLHIENGKVISVSGDIPADFSSSNNATMSSADAVNNALKEVNAETYKWQITEEEKWLQERTGNKSATFYPQPELVLFPNFQGNNNAHRFAYKMNIFASEPFLSEDVYIDAESGAVLFRHNMLKEVDSTGLAHTAFSGHREITADHVGQDFYLRENGRGNGIHTWNLNHNTNYSTRTEFTDEDNNWIYAQSDPDVYATDAHWGVEQGFDYLHAAFGRTSIDDAGFKLEAYIHYGEAFNGSFWDAQNKVMVFGDGNNNLVPHTTLDIVGHEMGHGLTQFTADLINMDESGAISESFSDILGNCIEHFGKPGQSSWRIGEDRGSFLRDMSFPNAKDHPDTYMGQYWYTGTSDNGGVHTNCGVQNYWFYLLSEGGNGVNDNGDSYNVTGIGRMNAALIAYRTLTVYLSSTSEYEDVSYFSTLAAKDIFGACSPQHEATVLAWNAVGINNEYIDHTVASFTADDVEYCNYPFSMAFINTSVNGLSYLWDFGDGNTSTELNPVHEYTEPGNYTVTLKADGDGCGEDMHIMSDLVTATEIIRPEAASTTVFKGDSVLLQATAENGEIHWYADEDLQTLLGKGNTYQTPSLENTVTYYLESVREGLEHRIGQDLDMVRNQSGSYSSTAAGILFDVYQDVVIKSVKVDAETGGIATFTILDDNGDLVFKKDVDLVSGIQNVDLNAQLSSGQDYEMHCDFASGTKNLWSSDIAEYPYYTSGLLSISGNTNDLSSYPFFFDWAVEEFNCESEMHSVTVSVKDINEVSLPTYNFYVDNSNGMNYFIDFFFKQNSVVKFGLYGINGQLVFEVDKDYPKGENTVDVNDLLGLNTYSTGVYFITISGGGVEETEKIVNKGGSN